MLSFTRCFSEVIAFILNVSKIQCCLRNIMGKSVKKVKLRITALSAPMDYTNLTDMSAKYR